MKRKTSLVSTLVHRALKICSKSNVKEEMNRIKEILLDNGYPEASVLKQISKKITQFFIPKRFSPDKCPVYLHVSYTGKTSLTLEKNVRTAVQNCYGFVTYGLYLFQDRCYLQVGKMFYLPIRRVLSSRSRSATVIVGT